MNWNWWLIFVRKWTGYQFQTEITERYDDSSGSREFEITTEQFQKQLEGEFSDILHALKSWKKWFSVHVLAVFVD